MTWISAIFRVVPLNSENFGHRLDTVTGARNFCHSGNCEELPARCISGFPLVAIDTANLRFSLAALELRTDALKSIALPLLAGTRGYAIRDLMGAIIEHSVAWLKVSRYMKAINFYVLEEEIVSLCRQDRPERSGKAGPAAWGEGKKLARVGRARGHRADDVNHRLYSQSGARSVGRR